MYITHCPRCELPYPAEAVSTQKQATRGDHNTCISFRRLHTVEDSSFIPFPVKSWYTKDWEYAYIYKSYFTSNEDVTSPKAKKVLHLGYIGVLLILFALYGVIVGSILFACLLATSRIRIKNLNLNIPFFLTILAIPVILYYLDINTGKLITKAYEANLYYPEIMLRYIPPYSQYYIQYEMMGKTPPPLTVEYPNTPAKLLFLISAGIFRRLTKRRGNAIYTSPIIAPLLYIASLLFGWRLFEAPFAVFLSLLIFTTVSTLKGIAEGYREWRIGSGIDDATILTTGFGFLLSCYIFQVFTVLLPHLLYLPNLTKLM